MPIEGRSWYAVGEELLGHYREVIGVTAGNRRAGMGGYRVLLGRRRTSALLRDPRPDRVEVSDRTTLRWEQAEHFPWAAAVDGFLSAHHVSRVRLAGSG